MKSPKSSWNRFTRITRYVACKRFVETILPGNPLYSIHNCSAPQIHGYNLRADNVAKKIKTRTDWFRNCHGQVNL